MIISMIPIVNSAIKRLGCKGLKVRMDIHQEAKVQQEISDMFFKQAMTPKQIALRRQTSIQAVYKIIAKLKEKQLKEGGLKNIEKTTPTHQPPHAIRLHGLHFTIKIIWKGDKYNQIYKKCNVIQYTGSKVKLWKDSLEIYIEKDFIAINEHEATGEAFLYLNHLLPKLENDLKLVLLKPRSQNIKVVSAHYAETNNELSKDYQYKGEYIQCYTKDDGKLWFLFDFSNKVFEAECVHPDTNKQDMTKVVSYFNDIRDNPHYQPSEIKAMFDKVIDVQNTYAALIQRHLNIQDETLKTLKKIQKNERQTRLM